MARRRRAPERRVGLLTGGGDCPGLNAAIRAVVKTSAGRGWAVTGILDGFDGLAQQRARALAFDDVAGILLEGGTILGSSSSAKGFPPSKEREVLRGVAAMRLDSLVVIGGDGTLRITRRLAAKGIAAVVIPKTIDNDVPLTSVAVGFSSAVSTAAHAIELLRSTARSHHRVMVIETMGREAGWLALAAGMAAGGDIIILPEFPFDMEEVRAAVARRMRRGRSYSLVVVAEGATVKGRRPTPSPGTYVAEGLRDLAETRLTVLGHLQRGGPPDAADRLLAGALGTQAVAALAEGDTGVLLAPTAEGIRRIPFGSIPPGPRLLPQDHPLLGQAADLGVVVAGFRRRPAGKRPS